MNHTSGIAILQAERVPLFAGAHHCMSAGFNLSPEICAFRRSRAEAGHAHQCDGAACPNFPKPPEPPEPVKRKVYPICLGWGRESCTKRVYYGSDRCRRHENQRIAATRKPARPTDPASKCGHPISSKNKTGYCRACNVKRVSPFVAGNPGYERAQEYRLRGVTTRIKKTRKEVDHERPGQNRARRKVSSK